MEPDFANCWICEGCGGVAEGVNPPDACSVCAHAYFESMADLLAERKGKPCDA